MVRKRNATSRNLRKYDDSTMSSMNFDHLFATNSNFSDWWQSLDSRWILSGGYLYLNHSDWATNFVYLKASSMIQGAYNKVIIEYNTRRESGSQYWDSQSVICLDGAVCSLVYFNGLNSTATFFSNSFSYTGVTGSDNYVIAEIENGLQKCYINGTLYKTTYNTIIFPIYFYACYAKNYVKFNRLKITASDWI